MKSTNVCTARARRRGRIVRNSSLSRAAGNLALAISRIEPLEQRVLLTASATPDDPAGDLSPWPASVGDRVWMDADADGIQDVGESGLDGVVVKLFNEAGLQGTTTTSGGGRYRLEGLAAADSYYLEFIRPAGFDFSPQDQGVHDALDSDVNLATGRTTVFTLWPGQMDLTRDAGLTLKSPPSVGGMVWNDVNGDGIRNANNSLEHGWPEIDVDLLGENGDVVAHTRTDADGRYRFDKLTPGRAYSVQVTFTWLTGVLFTLQDRGTDDTRDSDVDMNTGRTALFTLQAGQSIEQDAGVIVSVMIGGTAYKDMNGNGQREDEPPLAGRVVFIDANANGQFDPGEKSDITESDGRYLLRDLRPGTYRVAQVLEEGWVLTNPSAGYHIVELPLPHGKDLGRDFANYLFPSRNLTPVGPEFRVNRSTLGNQYQPSSAMDADGDFAVAWVNDPKDGSGMSICAQVYSSSGLPRGPELTVSDYVGVNPQWPHVAMDADGDFIVTWSEYSGVRVRRYSAAGEPQGASFTIPTSLGGSIFWVDAAMDRDGDFVVTWMDMPRWSHFEIVTQRFNAAGVPQGPALRVVPTGEEHLAYPAVAMDDEGAFVVTWTNRGETDWLLYAQRYSPTGGALGPTFLVNSGVPGHAQEAEAAMDDDGDFIISWVAAAAIYARRYDAAGAALGPGFRADTFPAGSHSPSVAFDGEGDFVISWENRDPDGGGYGNYARRYNAAGVPSGSEFLVNSRTAGWQYNPSVAADEDGDFVISWTSEDQDVSGTGVYAQRYKLTARPTSVGGMFWIDSDGNGVRDADDLAVEGQTVKLFTEAGALFAVTTTDANGRYQFTGLHDDQRYYVQFPEVAGYFFTAQDQGTDDTRDSDADMVTGRTGAFALAAGQADPAVDAGVVASARIAGLVYNDWNGNGTQDVAEPGLAGWGVYLDANGNGMPDAGEMSATTGEHGSYEMYVRPGTYRVVEVLQDGWRRTAPASRYYTVTLKPHEWSPGLVFGNAEVGPLPAIERAGGEFRVNTTTLDSQFLPDIAMDADGDFVVVWSSENAACTEEDVYAQRYNARGEPQGGEFMVNVATAGRQSHAAVAMDAAGSFVVIWADEQRDNYATRARRFNAAGVAQGGEFLVASATPGGHDVAMDANGDFVVAWSSYGGAGDERTGVHAQRYSAAGVAEGPEIHVNTYTADDQDCPAVAMDAAGDFAITWMSYGEDGSKWGICAQRYDAAGKPQGGEFRVNTHTENWQLYPAIAMDADGDFVVAWHSLNQEDSFDVYAQRFGGMGEPMGGEFRVNTYTEGNQTFPAVAMDADGDFIVTWQSNNLGDSRYEIYAQRYNAAGIAQGGEFRINTYTHDTQEYSGVAMDSAGDFAVAWMSNGQDGSSWGVYAQRYQLVAAHDAASVGGMVWADGGDDGVRTTESGLFGRTVSLFTEAQVLVGSAVTDVDGTYRFDGLIPGTRYYLEFQAGPGAVFTLQDQGNDDTRDSDANIVTGRTAVFALQPGQVDLTKDAGLLWVSYIWGTIFNDADADGTKDPSESVLPGWTAFIDTNANGIFDAGEQSATTDQTGQYVLADLRPGVYRVAEVLKSGWQRTSPATGYHVITLQSDDSSVGNDFGNRALPLAPAPLHPSFQVNTFTPGDQWLPNLATDHEGDYVVIWESIGQDGDNSGVYAQRYNAADEKQGAEFRVNTHTASLQSQAAVAMDADGDFVVTWASCYQDGRDGWGVYAQRYDASGVPQGGEFLVNVATSFTQAAPSVAMDDAGNIVIAWMGPGDADGWAVLARRFNAAGEPLTGEFLVNTTTSNNQDYPVVAMDGDGDFVVVWNNYIWDGQPHYDVRARRYSVDGTPQGGEFPVSTTSDVAHREPAAAMDDAGNFVIAWQSWSQKGVYARRFSAAGTPQVAEFRVGGAEAWFYGAPAVAMHPDGEFLVTWCYGSRTGRLYDARGRLYDSAGMPQGDEFVIGAVGTGNQGHPVAAMTGTADLIVAWQDESRDGSGHGIFAQRYVRSPQAASVGGIIWHDADADGIRDTGESAWAGVEVRLYTGGGSPVATARTGADGRYRFDGLQPGQWLYIHVEPADRTDVFFTLQNQGTDDALDSDVDAATGETAAFVLWSAQTDLTQDAGLLMAGTIGGVVFDDLDQDGLRDDRETGLPARTVYIDANANGKLEWGETYAWTDAVGRYEFAHLRPGAYRVTEIVPTGVELTHPADGHHAVQLASNQSSPDNDFGNVGGSIAFVGGIIWNDLNDNGVRDPDEPPLSGFGASVCTQDGVQVAWATSDHSGRYVFGSLTPGEPYYLQFYGGTGWLFARQDQGADDTLDSDPDMLTGLTPMFTMASGQVDLTKDAGMVLGAFVSGTVYEDYNSDGHLDAGEQRLGNWTVYVDANANGQMDGDEPSYETNSDGFYSFGPLRPGTRRIAERVYDGWAPVSPPGGSCTLQLEAGDWAEAHFGNRVVPIEPATVGGVVWMDNDYDGVRQTQDRGVAGFTVSLMATGNVCVESTATDQDGRYRFEGAPTGVELYIIFHPSTGLPFTRQDQGADDANDSDADPISGRTASFTLASGQTLLTWDAGVLRHATIGGIVFNDLNGNGVQDAGEGGLSNRIVYVDVDGDGRFNGTELNSVTSVQGHFDIYGLMPGTYRVGLVGKDGWEQTSPPGFWHTVTLASEQTVDIAFGSWIPSPDVVLPVGPEFCVGGDIGTTQFAPATAMDAEGNFVVVWTGYVSEEDGTDIYAQLFDADGTDRSSPFRVNAVTAGHQECLSVAMDADGDFVIAWTTPGDVGFDICAQRFDSGGVPQGSPFFAGGHVGSQYRPSVAISPADGSFVVAWEDTRRAGEDPSIYVSSIYAQRFNYEGSALGPEFRVNSGNDGLQFRPAAAMAVDSSFVIAWYNEVADDPYQVHIRRYNALGLPQGDEAHVNADTHGQGNPAIAMDRTGNFVVAWDFWTEGADSGPDIHALRYDASGTPQGREVTVNTLTAGPQRYPALAMDADGDFIVTWDGVCPDGSTPYGIYARSYTAAGAPEGNQFPVSSPRNAGQRDPAVAMDADGDFVVVWQAENRDNGRMRLYAQRYTRSDRMTSVGGITWLDDNGNGVRDANEKGIDGVHIGLYTESGEFVSGPTSEYGGRYRIDDLRPGKPYYLQFVLPSGLIFTHPHQGTDDSLDSDVDPVTFRTPVFTLTAGQIDLTQNAGFFDQADIWLYAFDDRNANGRWDYPAEDGLSGATFFVDDNANGQLDDGERSYTGDEWGRFHVFDLWPGTYRIAQIVKPGWAQTVPATGSYTIDAAAGTVFELPFGSRQASTDLLADIVDVAPDPRPTGVSQMTIVFPEPVRGFDLPDLKLNRNGGQNLLTSDQTLTSTDGITWTLGNLSGLTFLEGPYTLTLTAGDSGITDLTGRPLAFDATESFTVNQTTLRGTPDDDTFIVRHQSRSILVFLNSATEPAWSIPHDQVSKLNLHGGDGNDTFWIGGTALGQCQVRFDGGGQGTGDEGGDRVVLTGLSGASVIYEPGGSAAGSGMLRVYESEAPFIGRFNLLFDGMEHVNVSPEHDTTVTLVTPNPDDDLTVIKGGEGETLVRGSSGGVPIASLNIDEELPLLILDAARNDAGAGNDTIHIPDGMPSDVNLTVLPGTGDNRVIVDGGAVSLPAIHTGSFALAVNHDALVTIHTASGVAVLDINDSARVNVRTNVPGVLRLKGLSISGHGTLDLGGNDLIVGAPSGASAAALAQIRNLIAGARNSESALWTGSGVTSSAAAADPSMGLGVMLLDANAAAILVRHAWNGDANLDGMVNADDYFLIDSGFISQKAAYHDGDFNYDGAVNADDYFLIDNAFLAQSSSLAAGRPSPAVADDVIAIARSTKQAPYSGATAELFSTTPVL